jgi:hypothetical protein
MIRAVTDRAAQQHNDVALMIGAEPSPLTNRTARTILAAVAAFLAEEYSIRAPRWVRETQPLDQPWYLPGTPTMIEQARRRCPPVISRYNVWLRPDVLRRQQP